MGSAVADAKRAPVGRHPAAEWFRSAGRQRNKAWTAAGNGRKNLIDSSRQHHHVGAVCGNQKLMCGKSSYTKVNKLIAVADICRTKAGAGLRDRHCLHIKPGSIERDDLVRILE